MNSRDFLMLTAVLFAILMFLEVSTLASGELDVYGRDISQHEKYPAMNCSDSPPQKAEQPRGVINFDPYVIYPTGSWPEVVAIGEINNDNLNDVVLGTSYCGDTLNDYKIFVFAQNLSGELDPPVKYDGGDIRAIDIGDLNSDTLQDVIIGYDDSIGIFFQDISGTLQPMTTYYSGNDVDGVKIGDFNNDNLMDIVVCHWNSDFIRVFIQEAYGVFDSTVTYPINQGGYDEIDVGDVTGDGLDDVIFMRGQLYANENIAVFAQYSTGLLMPPVFYDLGNINTHGVAVGDVNDDLKNDVLVTHGGNQPSATVSVWLQDTSGTLLDPPVNYSCYDCPEPIEIADFDIDGRNDVVVGNGGWMAISVYQQNTGGGFDPYINFSIPYASYYQPQGLAVRDINDDSKPDIAIADYNNGLVVLRNTSTVSVKERPGQTQAAARDFALLQNCPNPFNTTTAVRFNLVCVCNITLKVHNIAGQEVATLVDGKLQPGEHNVVFDAKSLGSGVYYYRLQAGTFVKTKRCLLVR